MADCSIYLVRHTPVALSSARYCYGWSDLDLDPDFEKHIADVRARSDGLWQNPLVFSSPLKRCRQLALALAPDPAAVIQDDRLKEMNFGDWEGMLWDDIPREAMDAWAADFVNRPAPGGEASTDLFARMRSFRDELAARVAREEIREVLVVSHGGVIRAWLAEVLGVPPEKSFNLEIDPGGISCVAVRGSGERVRFVNLRTVAGMG